jgi:PAS domain S-box-containing protein
MSVKKKRETNYSRSASEQKGMKNRDELSSEIGNRKKILPKITNEKTLVKELSVSKRKLRETRANFLRDIAELKKGEREKNTRLENLSAVVECADGPVFSVDRKYCYTSFNHQHAEIMKTLFGADIQIGGNLLDYHTNAVDRKRAKSNIDRALKGETIIEESLAGEETKTRRYFEIAHYPVWEPDGKVKGVAIYARDKTELKKREEENKRIDQTLRALSNSNQAMMRAKGEMEYMKEVCRNIEKDCGFSMVWIGLAENGKTKSVRPIVSSGFEEGYLEKANITWADNVQGRGPTGTAIRTGKVCICQNMLTDPKFKPWRAEAIKRGYASSIALPLIAGDRPFGALTIYSSEPESFPDEEVKLLSELTSDLAYGISVFRLRDEQAKNEKALHESGEQLQRANELLDTVTEGTGVIIATQDTNFNYTYFNRPYKEEIKRLTGKELSIGSSMKDIFAEIPEQRDIAVREWSQVFAGVYTSNILEFGDPGRYRRKYNIRHTPIRDLNGNIIGAGEVAYDISEQEQAKLALAESEARYQSLFNRMTEGFALHEIICDENKKPCDYRFLDVNPAFEQLTGLKRTEIIGKCMSEVAPLQGDDPRWIEICGKVALSGEPVQFENYSTALKRHYAVQAFQPEPGRFAVVFENISERKSSEETRNWLASFPELNPSPVVEVDFQGIIQYINPAAQKAFPDLLKKGFQHPWFARMESVVQEFQKREVKTITRDVSVGDTDYQQTLSFIAENQRIRIYSVEITARIKAEEGLRKAREQLEIRVKERTQELLGINKQLQMVITERQRAEAALVESEGRYRTLFETSPDTIILVDMNYKILFANQQAATIHCYGNSKKLIGMDVKELIAPEDREHVLQSFLKTLELGTLRDIEYKILTNNEEKFPAELNISVVRNDSGQPIGYLMDVRDITERKWAEESLRLAYAYNRSLIEASLDPLVTITPEGKIGDVNKATETVTGYTRDELIGTDFHSYFNDPEMAQAGYQKVFENGTVRDYNLEIRNKNGSITPVLYNASVYHNEGGQVMGIFAAARDITDRKQFETQLVQAEKHAIIGRMVGSITHEINNPLQTIKNCLYLIQQDVTPESPIQEPLEMAASETLRLTNLVGHLRELYRPKGGITREPHEVLDILEEVHSLLIPHLNSARVQWQALPGLRRCYIDCIRDQILEVFLNLSMNAIEAMQKRGGMLYVDMIQSEDKIGVILRDTGPGIPEEIAQHLFEPFMTTKASGLGLGLSISYGIVQRHGGQIQVENQPGGGAIFTIWLPLNASNAMEE